MIEYYLLEQLIAFADNGTLSKAAKALHVSQPALSRSMRKLEALFGVPLFNRSKSHIELNQYGQLAVNAARQAMIANQRIIPTITEAYTNAHTIKIVGTSTIAINRLINRCQGLFPSTTITSSLVKSEKVQALLISHTYNLAVTHQAIQDPRFICQPFFKEQLMISIPKNHPLAMKQSISFNDLDGVNILAHAGAGFWIDLCQQQIPHPQLIVQDKMQTLAQLVHASTLPVFNSNQTHYDDPDRVNIPIRDKEATVIYYLICLKNNYQRFYDILH